ncbi:MAG: HTTM domain-containing protein [Myxococcota bacterium]
MDLQAGHDVDHRAGLRRAPACYRRPRRSAGGSEPAKVSGSRPARVSGSHNPVVGPLLARDTTAWVMSYGGLAFDLLVGPALCWRRSRPFAMVAAFGFHCTNAFLFEIGIFPWLMMASTLLFLPPSWPRAVGLLPAAAGTTAPLPARGARGACDGARRVAGAARGAAPSALALPRRCRLDRGGHYFSWRTKLRGKEGRARFRVVDADTDEIREVFPKRTLPKRIARELPENPDMVLQYAHELAAQAAAEGRRVQVFADVFVSLNGRPERRLVDPDVDLAAQPRTLAPAMWILPLEEPLPGWSW